MSWSLRALSCHHPCSALGRWDLFRFTARQVVLKRKFPNQAKYGRSARGPHSVACLHLFQAHPQQYASRIPSFYFLSMFPPQCHVRLSVSGTDNITIASMFLGPKNATNMGHKNKPALFGEDTGGSKFWDPILGPRKLVLRGTSSHCSDLPLAPRRDAKASPSHLPVHLLQASCRGSHTHTHMGGPPRRGQK